MSGIVNVLQFAVDGLTQQQQVIANNLANSETPGYTAQDVNFQNSLAQALSNSNGATASVTTTPDSAAPATDGNNVDTGNQMINAEQNTLQYQATVELLNAQFRLVQGSAGGSFS
ncbi:MAG TPA: flagellar basal body protein [Acidimicrobiales bacterium]|jgi:flagellar basal-body rod protein FlgB|nr:flagellar basal body protein [Acidimicrobiales bacterium]